MRKDASETPTIARFFAETLLVSLLTVGGGYAILLVLDDVFSRRRWFRKGELVERLALFQSVPGLIAGNVSIYAGMRLFGRAGALAGLVATALPPFLVFLAVSRFYAMLPLADPRIAAACSGLRAALAGVVAATLAKAVQNAVRGFAAWTTAAVATVLVVLLGVNPAFVLVGAMAFGAFLAVAGFAGDFPEIESFERAPLRRRTVAVALALVLLAAAAVFEGPILCEFFGFGCLCFGGGFPLVPIYMEEFVGPSAPLMQMPESEFADVMALSQATPGPVGVNAATFFGYRMGGAAGALVATAALLAPSWIFMTAALSGMSRWRNAAWLKGAFAYARAATPALLASALVAFTRLAVFPGRAFDATAALIAFAVAVAVWTGRMRVMAAIFTGAAASLAASLIASLR